MNAEVRAAAERWRKGVYPIGDITRHKDAYALADAYTESELELEFDSDAVCVLRAARKMLIKHFGERCPDYEPECECCKRWKLLDDLIANPFND